MCKLTENNEFIKVIKVKPLDNYHVLVEFENGVIKDYDAKDLIQKRYNRAWKDINLFKQNCCIINYSLAWNKAETNPPDEYNCIDLDPGILYNESTDARQEDIDKWL